MTLYHGDFREQTDPIGADVCIVDPPYEEIGLAWDTWPNGWPAVALTHIKPAGSLWCWGGLRMFTTYWAEFAGWKLAQDLVWEKHNGSSLHADRFRRVHEHVLHFYPKKCRWADVHKAPIFRQVEGDSGHKIQRQKKPEHWNSIQREAVGYEYDGTRLATTVIFERGPHGSADHPTQKPIAISRDLVTYSTPPPRTCSGSDVRKRDHPARRKTTWAACRRFRGHRATLRVSRAAAGPRHPAARIAA